MSLFRRKARGRSRCKTPVSMADFASGLFPGPGTAVIPVPLQHAPRRRRQHNRGYVSGSPRQSMFRVT